MGSRNLRRSCLLSSRHVHHGVLLQTLHHGRGSHLSGVSCPGSGGGSSGGHWVERGCGSWETATYAACRPEAQPWVCRLAGQEGHVRIDRCRWIDPPSGVGSDRDIWRRGCPMVPPGCCRCRRWGVGRWGWRRTPKRTSGHRYRPVKALRGGSSGNASPGSRRPHDGVDTEAV